MHCLLHVVPWCRDDNRTSICAPTVSTVVIGANDETICRNCIQQEGPSQVGLAGNDEIELDRHVVDCEGSSQNKTEVGCGGRRGHHGRNIHGLGHGKRNKISSLKWKACYLLGSQPASSKLQKKIKWLGTIRYLKLTAMALYER